jgi:hypothetical protein
LKTQQDYKGKNNMNKKAQVKMLLDMVSNIKSIPTTDEHSIDMKRFYQVPEIKAIITLLKLLKVNAEYLSKNGFVVAFMLLGRELKERNIKDENYLPTTQRAKNIVNDILKS